MNNNKSKNSSKKRFRGLIRMWEKIVEIAVFLKKHHVPEKVINFVIRSLEIIFYILELFLKIWYIIRKILDILGL